MYVMVDGGAVAVVRAFRPAAQVGILQALSLRVLSLLTVQIPTINTPKSDMSALEFQQLQRKSVRGLAALGQQVVRALLQVHLAPLDCHPFRRHRAI